MDKSKIAVTGAVSFADTETFKEADLLGNPHTILPAVLMVEGAYYPDVASNESPSSLHFSSNELKESVNTWNGRPVALNHPDQKDTCNSPETFDKQWVGYVFNTRYDDQSRSLKADLWIDNNRGKFITKRVKNGEHIDVSIGAFGDLIPPRSSAPDVNYDYSMSNIVGDHLAVLPDGVGACSWKDGCGIRAKAYCPGGGKRDKPRPLINNKNEKDEVMADCDKKVDEVVEKIGAAVDKAAEAKPMVEASKSFDEVEWLKSAPRAVQDRYMAALKNDEEAKKKHIDKIVSCKTYAFCEKKLGKVNELSILEGISTLVDALDKEDEEKGKVSDYQLRASAAKGASQDTAEWATFKDIDFTQRVAN